MKSILLPLAVLSFFFWCSTAFAQEDSATAVQRLDTQWIVAYEQMYGIWGLYVEEPPAREGDEAARVRRELLELTLAAREYLANNPGGQPTLEVLRARGLIQGNVSPPEGEDYLFSEETNRYVCTAGGPYSIVFGAMRQLRQAENYRERVFEGGRRVYANWRKMLEMENLPQLIKRELETRRFAILYTDNPRIDAARETQALLQELHDAIQMAMRLGQLEKDQEITMQDVGATGFIDMLEALPLGGEYKVTKAGERPVAVFGETEIPLDPDYMNKRLKFEAEKALEENPDYPPAIALHARYLPAEEGLKELNRAISMWPDVPALRIQRLAIFAWAGRVDAFRTDLDYIMERFPTTPLLLEIEMATSHGGLKDNTKFRATITEAMANLRPESLNLQLLALQALRDNGDTEGGKAIYDRLLSVHPGYEPLLPDPANPAEESGDAEEENATSVPSDGL